MKYSNRRHRGIESRRSARMDLNPYMIEDIALTLGELEYARSNRSNGPGRFPVTGDERDAGRVTMSDHPSAGTDPTRQANRRGGSRRLRTLPNRVEMGGRRSGSTWFVPEDRVCLYQGTRRTCRSGMSPVHSVFRRARRLSTMRSGWWQPGIPRCWQRVDIAEQPPAAALTDASRSADLLVVGARGRGGFKGLILGSVSDKCIQYAHCPVAVVRADPDELPLRATATADRGWSRWLPRIQPGPAMGAGGGADPLGVGGGRLRVAVPSHRHLRAAPAHGYAIAATGDRPGRHRVRGEVGTGRTLSKWTFGSMPPFRRSLTHPKEQTSWLPGRGATEGSRTRCLGSVAHQCARHASCTVVVARSLVPEDDVSAKAPSDSGSLPIDRR